MSHLEQYKKRIAELAERSIGTEQLYYGLLTAFGSSLAIIADELHELNRSIKNGQTVQEGSDQTRT